MSQPDDDYGPAEDERLDWLSGLDILDLESGLAKAQQGRACLLAVGKAVLFSRNTISAADLMFGGFVARGQGLHEGTISAVQSQNPYAAFTVLRSYAENAAAILYATKHPNQFENFLRERTGKGVSIGKITNYAERRMKNFRTIYSQLSQYAHPQSLSLLASFRGSEDGQIDWSSAPRFRAERDAMTCCGWVYELAHATTHLLVEFAEQYRVGTVDGRDEARRALLNA